jgi:D-alanyl-D-alanine dipeptidase
MTTFPLVDVLPLAKKYCKHAIECKLAYATNENFLGRIVAGYHPDVCNICYLTPNAAEALCKVQDILNKKQLGLFVFDSYRPLRAVRDFNHWMRAPVKNDHELARKEIHYPHVEKNQLAVLGYVCDDVSNHCFGDTIDLSLIELSSKKFLNMGACFDFFDEISYPAASAKMIGQEAFDNRRILSDAMQEAGFLPYEKEYWHFTFRQRDVKEPLDIEIK